MNALRALESAALTFVLEIAPGQRALDTLRSLHRQSQSADRVTFVLSCAAADPIVRHEVQCWADDAKNVVVHDENEPLTLRKLHQLVGSGWIFVADPDTLFQSNFVSGLEEILTKVGADVAIAHPLQLNDENGLVTAPYRLPSGVVDAAQIAHFALGIGGVAVRGLPKCWDRFGEVPVTYARFAIACGTLLESSTAKLAVLPQGRVFRLHPAPFESRHWKDRSAYVSTTVHSLVPLLKISRELVDELPDWLAYQLLREVSRHIIEGHDPRGRNAWIANDEQHFTQLWSALEAVVRASSIEQIYRADVATSRDTLLALKAAYRPFLLQSLDSTRVMLSESSELEAAGERKGVYAFGKLVGYVVELDGQVSPNDLKDLERYRVLAPASPTPQPRLVRLAGENGTRGLNNLLTWHHAARSLSAPAVRKKRGKALRQKVLDKGPVVLRRLSMRATVKVLKAALPRLGNINPYRDIWIIMDRMSGANDNGEHFYRYLKEKNVPENIVFMVGKKSPDFQRLKEEGFRILPRNSVAVTTAFLSARVIAASDWAFADLQYLWRLQASAEKKPLVFLQHGVTKNDISAWINSIGIDLFVTTLPEEHAYISAPSSPYNFAQDQVIRPGLARYDRLLELSRRSNRGPGVRRILVMPTWRNSLRDALREVCQVDERKNRYRESELCIKWNEILNHPKIVAGLDAGAIEVSFISHPNMVEFLAEHTFDPRIKRLDIRSVDFQQLLTDSDVLCTDYSSTAFDAVIAGAEVVYYQFDRDEFFGGTHGMRPGWFSYDDDGYGPVTTDVDTTIEYLLASCDNPVYRQRCHQMRASVPMESCRHTYEEIKRRFGN